MRQQQGCKQRKVNKDENQEGQHGSQSWAWLAPRTPLALLIQALLCTRPSRADLDAQMEAGAVVPGLQPASSLRGARPRQTPWATAASLFFKMLSSLYPASSQRQARRTATPSRYTYSERLGDLPGATHTCPDSAS